MRIVVFGGGALGSLFAALLDGAAAVTLVDRSADHVAAVERDGLRVVGATERHAAPAATTDPAAAPTPDLLLLAVKSHQTAAAMADARPLCGEATDVLTLQNGLGNAETVGEFVPAERVLAGTTAHGATLLGPGRVRHAGTGRTRLGRWDAPNDARVDAVASTFAAAGVPTEVVADVHSAVWEKVLVNVGINAATALADVDNGALAETAAGRRLVRAAVTEAARVARAEGATVAGDPIAETLAVARATASNVSSMRADRRAGQRTEVEALHGAVLERAERHDLPAPAVRTLADLVRLSEAGYSSGAGSGSDSDSGYSSGAGSVSDSDSESDSVSGSDPGSGDRGQP